jgi:hypothetical protein
MQDRCLNANDRKTKIAIKRAVVSAGNKAEVDGNGDVALIYRKTHQDMLLPAKDGLVYAHDASGKLSKIDYGWRSLTELEKDREYNTKWGLTGEIAKIDKELAKRIRDRAVHSPDRLIDIDRRLDLNLSEWKRLDQERHKAAETETGMKAFMDKQNALQVEHTELMDKRVLAQALEEFHVGETVNTRERYNPMAKILEIKSVGKIGEKYIAIKVERENGEISTYGSRQLHKVR